MTELKCGGLVIGCTFDHRAADAYSANMFLTAWAEVAQSKKITSLPTFRRSLLNPRRPPQPHESLDKFYVPLSSLPCDESPHDHLTSRIYYVKSEEIDRIQSEASCSDVSKRSRIESFSAFIWKSIADTSAAHRSGTVKLGIVIDGRSRLITSGKGESRPLDRYLGNVLSIPYVEASVSDLQAASLESVAKTVHGFVAAAATAEHFLALIDWVELRRPKPAVVKVYCKDENEHASVVVSSGQRFPISDLDFGWGGPVFGSYHFPWGGETGYVMPMPSADGNGAWIVYMHLMVRHLDLLEARAPHVFIPFDHTFLSLDA